MPTDKYDLHTIDYSVQGWDAILATDMEKLDDVVPARLLGTLGETVAAYEAVYLKASDSKWYKAKADGVLQPCLGIALEAGDADDPIRVHRLGEIENVAWAWALIGKPIYLDITTAGAMTQTMPGANVQILGYALSATKMVSTIDFSQPAVGTAGGTVITQTTVAGEVIAAGNVVFDSRNGVRKGFGVIAAVTEQDLEGAAVTLVAMCALSATLFVRIYMKTGDSKLYGKAFTVNADNSITDGAEATLANYAIGGTWIVVRRVTDTQFMAGWIKAADSTGKLISGTVGALNAITLGAEAGFHGAATGSFDFKFSSTTWILAYRDQGDSNYGHVVAGTVDGAAAITVGTDIKWVSAAVDDIAVGIVPVVYGGGTNNRFIIAYERGGNTYYEILGSWTGTIPAVTGFTEYGAIESVAITGNDIAVIDNKTWMRIYQFQNAGGTRLGYLLPGFLYGYDVTYGIKALFMAQGAGTLGRNFVHVVNPNVFIMSGDVVNAGQYQYNLVRWRNWGMEVLGGAIHATDLSHASALSTDGKLFLAYFTDAADGHHPHLLGYDIGVPLGIATEANNGGTALRIAVSGALTVSAWGLTSKRRHYAQTDGTLTVTSNGWPIVDAFSTTEGLIFKQAEML